MSASATKQMNYYEGMFLIDSAKFAADHDGVINELMDVLNKCEAEVVAHRPWQDGKLAYEIDGHRKGLHYLVLFRMPPSQNSRLTRQGQLSDLIIRQLVIKHPKVLFDANVAAITGAQSEGDDEDAASDE